MTSIKFLYAAYAATWVIHGLYLGSLMRRHARLQRRMKDLGR